MVAMKLSLSITANVINRLLAVPAVVTLLETYDVKRPIVGVSPSGVSIKATIRGTRCKVKLGLGARTGFLLLNIRDVKIGSAMVSVGGDWLEPWIAKVPKVRYSEFLDSLTVLIPGIHFHAIGTQGDTLHCVCEVTQ